MRYFFSAVMLVASATLAACGGGSGSASSATLPNTSPQGSAKQLTVAFSGNTTSLSTARHSMAVSGTTVSVTLNGKTVGSGQLDSSGKASIKLDQDIPPGSTLTITAGSVSATMVWNQTSEDAAVLIQLNSDGTLGVSVASGDQPEASPSPDDPNGSTSAEESNGTPTTVDDGDKNAVLPANLPVSVTSTCTNVTLTPLSSKIATMRFEENVRDGEDGSKYNYQGPFTAAMSFPLVAQSARLEIQLFDAANVQLLDVKAPINAFTAQAGQPTPAPYPTISASPEPNESPEPSDSPEPTESPEPSPSPSSTP